MHCGSPRRGLSGSKHIVGRTHSDGFPSCVLEKFFFLIFTRLCFFLVGATLLHPHPTCTSKPLPARVGSSSILQSGGVRFVRWVRLCADRWLLRPATYQPAAADAEPSTTAGATTHPPLSPLDRPTRITDAPVGPLSRTRIDQDSTKWLRDEGRDDA
ncbi:hypothetical protein CPAR01_10389 [Colletotrichum paranaense]|uniref:Secreted protein n=1 Tax=Colletotrichum paranaense TaxID=1914294 RepID=A0ABQ9SDV1_9PEZI|nr:uncharacterized protein CPAR01_10389 [Colletotrichum paranaense]KAK1533681.1 hypothetical protein CPAR01_10389 [Colletotrichum paranaense]